MRTLIVHNPRSGFGSDAVYQFQRALLQQGDEVVFRMLEDDFDPADAVAGAKDFDLVTVSGGDGTVASVLHALAGTGVPVCAFPSGTANLLNANIGNAPEPRALARACREGTTADLDLGVLRWADETGSIHENGFALMSGTGYDAQLMQAALPNKAMMGEAAYYAAALANPRPKVLDFTIDVDGEVYQRSGIMCLVANTATIQGDINIIPDCRMDDGMLDVIVVELSRPSQLLRPLFFGLVDKEGNKMGRPHIESFRGKKIVVETTEPVPIEIDGEAAPVLATRYEAEALPGAARLVVDAMSPYGHKSSGPARFGEVKDVAYPK